MSDKILIHKLSLASGIVQMIKDDPTLILAIISPSASDRLEATSEVIKKIDRYFKTEEK